MGVMPGVRSDPAHSKVTSENINAGSWNLMSEF